MLTAPSRQLGKPEGEIDWADQWWHRSYDSLNIQIAVSDDGSSDGSSDSSSSDDSSESDSGRATTSMAPTPTTPGSVVPTDEELLRACGGRRLGMRARATQLGKWKRVEGADVVTGKVLNEGVVPVRTPRSTGVPQPAVSAAAAVVGALEAKKKARKQGEQREDGEAASKAEQRAERLRRKLEKELKRQRRQERRERKAQQQAAAADATADARKRKRAARGAPEGGERATAAAGSTVPVSDLHPAGGERAAVRESKKARKRSQTAE